MKPPSSGTSSMIRRRRSGSASAASRSGIGRCGDLLVGRMEQQRVHAALQAVQDADRCARRPGRRSASPSSCASSSRPSTSRHTSGAESGWLTFTLTGWPVSAASLRIHGHSSTGTTGVVGRELEHAVARRGGWPRRCRAARVRRRACRARARRPWRGAAACDWWRSRTRRRAARPPRAPAIAAMSSSRRRRRRCAAIAHHVGAQRTVRDLRADVEHASASRPAASRYSGKLLPPPRDAFGERAAGDVLHAFHQLDQPVVTIGCGRREPDAAVAHHHGGDAVPARRRHPRVPGHLRVVVGVHVHEARCEQRPSASHRPRATARWIRRARRP